jgi:hypothetical protein
MRVLLTCDCQIPNGDVALFTLCENIFVPALSNQALELKIEHKCPVTMTVPYSLKSVLFTANEKGLPTAAYRDDEIVIPTQTIVQAPVVEKSIIGRRPTYIPVSYGNHTSGISHRFTFSTKAAPIKTNPN